VSDGQTDDEVEAARVARARAVGMFRYRLIRDAADPALTSRQRGRMVRALAAVEHTDPSGQQVRYSRDHLDRWIRAWRAGGFDALVPAGRAPHARIDAGVLEVAVALKRERPGRTCAQIAQILRIQTGWSPSETTLLRHFHRQGLQIRTLDDGTDTTTVFGRFEADRVNELWTGDALHGPRIGAVDGSGGRKTYLFAFLDDHSRMIVGARWGFAEDTVRLAAALRPALAARGVPEAVYVDNGSAFVDAWLLRACAHLGIKLTHSTPGRPQGRGKIERFFKTVNDQFLVEIAPSTAGQGPLVGLEPAAALLELNRLFTGWVEQVYHRRVHSETDQTPLARWDAAWADVPPPRPSPAALAEAFRWEARRRVTKTATVSLHGNTYLVEAVLAGRTVELVFDPFDLTRIEVRHAGRPVGLAVPHVVTRHSHPKARPELPAPAPASTGIDYLRLVADAHHQQIAATVNYAALTSPPAGIDGTDDSDGSERCPDPDPDQHPDQMDIYDVLGPTHGPTHDPVTDGTNQEVAR
jgi:putative transposase